MRKEEFIAKFGIERYRQHCDYCNRQRIGEVAGRSAIAKGMVNSFTYKITIPSPKKFEDKGEETECRERIAAELQKEIRRAYAPTTLRQHIIVVNDSRYAKKFIFRCELNQLSMKQKDIDNFSVVCRNCEAKIGDFVFQN